MRRAVVCALIALALAGCTASSSPPVAPSGSGGMAGSGGAVGAGGSGGGGGSAMDAAPDLGPSSGTGGTGSGGATGSDAATTDVSGGSDTGGGPADSNPGAACPAGALLCDNFDKYTTTASLMPDWRVTATGGTVQVDTTRVYGGGKSLHLTTMAGGGSRSAVITKEGAPFPVPGNAFFGRMMIWLNQMPTGGVHWNNVQSSGPLPNSTRTAKFGFGGMFARLMAGYVVREGDAIRIDCSSSAQTGIPEKKWVCLEWHFDGSKDEMHHWFDGKLLTEVDVIKKGQTCVSGQAPPDGLWHSPTFSNLILGWQHYQTTPIAVEMWIDDLVLASQPIGCPAPPP